MIIQDLSAHRRKPFRWICRRCHTKHPINGYWVKCEPCCLHPKVQLHELPCACPRCVPS